jgi:hypothetical protein
MKTPRIIDVLGNLDDDLINEAFETSNQAIFIKEKKNKRLRGFVIAAAAVLLALCIVWGNFNFIPETPEYTDSGEAGYESELDSTVVTEIGKFEIEMVSRYPGDMSTIVYGQVVSDDPNASEPVPPIDGVVGEVSTVHWNGINVTLPLYYMLNRYDEADVPYALKVILDEKIENIKEYARIAKEIREKYDAAESELYELTVMNDRWNDVIEKMQACVSNETYAVTVEKVFGKHVADEFYKDGKFDRDAFITKYGAQIDHLYNTEILEEKDDLKYEYAAIVLQTANEFENPADSPKFNEAFVALYGEQIYDSYMIGGFFDFYSFCFSNEGLELRTYFDYMTGMRGYLQVLKSEIADISSLEEDLREAAGKYYADGYIDYDLYEKDMYELYERTRNAEIELENLWTEYYNLEAEKVLSRLSGIDAEIVTLDGEIVIYIDPDKLSELEAFPDLVFASANRISSFSNPYYNWNGIAVQIELFNYLISNSIDSSNRYAVGISLSEQLYASEEWLALQKEYDRLSVETSNYEQLLEYVTMLYDKKYSYNDIKDKVLGSFGVFGEKAVDKYFSGSEFDTDAFKIDCDEAFGKLSEIKEAMKDCADLVSKEIIEETYSVFSDQVEYISVDEKSAYVIIYVTAEELVNLEGVEAYRFSLVPSAQTENTEAADTVFSHDSRQPIDMTEDTTDPQNALSPDSLTPVS